MSWEATAWAMRKGKDYELEPITRFVMLTLANYADKEGNDIYPSLGTLEADTGLSERTIRRHIKTLMAVGLLAYGDQDVVKRNPKIRPDQRPKAYRFIFDPSGSANLGDVGRMPTSQQRPDRKSTRQNPVQSTAESTNDRTESPAVKDERPDFQSETTGQTTGQRVHQTVKPLKEPSDVDAEAIEAGRKLREAIRMRNAQRGTFAGQAEA